MEACWIGDYEKVSRLVLEGADVNAQNTNGTTALMYAKTYTFATGDTRIITLLLRSGADAATKDNFGKTASDYTRERADLVLTLLDPTKIHSND